MPMPTTFDPLAVAVDWLDACRSGDLEALGDLYDEEATQECDREYSVLVGPVAELVGIEVGVVSGVMNLESSGVEASDWRPRHEEFYHDA